MQPSLVSSTRCAVGLITLLALPLPSQTTVRYRLTVNNTWSTTTHAGAFPTNAHFSWMGGGTHDTGVAFWTVGQLASPGMVQMAETGVTTILEGEVAKAKAQGTAGSVLSWHHWFCPTGTVHPSCGSLVVEFDVDQRHPLVTLVTMLGPSPDWFVGVAGLPLRAGGQWLRSVVVDLRPYDGGSRSANAWALGGPLTNPRDPITLITTKSGQLVGPTSLGTFTFELLPSVKSFGTSCGPTLAAATGSRPAIGTTFTLVTRNLANSSQTALMSAGLSNTSMLGAPLPLRLDSLGMKGCFLYHSLDAAWMFPVQNGVGLFSIPIANNPAFVGTRVFFQSAVGSVTSNGGETLIGHR